MSEYQQFLSLRVNRCFLYLNDQRTVKRESNWLTCEVIDKILWHLRLRYNLPLILLSAFVLIVMLILDLAADSNIVLQDVGRTLSLVYFGTMIYFAFIKKDNNDDLSSATSTLESNV